MRYKRLFSIVVLIGALGSNTISLAGDKPPLRDTETIKFSHEIPNIKNKKMVVVAVDYPPGAKSVPHRHANSAFIYAYVLSGAVKSQVDNEPARIYRQGEGWYESPGAHHKISENVSDKEPAKLLAIFVVNDEDKQLTTPDKGQE